MKDFKLSHNKIIFVVATLQFIFSALTIQQIKTDNPFYFKDSPGYISTSNYFLGIEDRRPLVDYRLFGPILPLMASFISPLFGIVNSYLLVNLALLISSSYLFYFYLYTML